MSESISFNKVFNFAQEAANTAGYLGDTNDGLDKTFKIAGPFFELLRIFGIAANIPAIDLVGDQMKSFTSAYGAVKVVGPVKDFVCADKKTGKMFVETARWESVVSKVCLTALYVLNSLQFLDSVKAIDLAKLAQPFSRIPIVGAVPLAGVTSGLALGVSGFGAADNVKTLINNKDQLAKQNLRLDKWRTIDGTATDEAGLRAINDFKQRLDRNYQAKLDALPPAEERTKEQVEKASRIQLWKGKLNNDFTALIKHKIARLEMKVNNTNTSRTQTSFTLAMNVVRAVGAIFSLTVMVMALSGFAIAVSLATVSLIVGVVTLAEFLARYKLQEQKLPQLV